MDCVIYLLCAECDRYFCVLARANSARQPVAVQHAREPVDGHVHIQLPLLVPGPRSISSHDVCTARAESSECGIHCGLLHAFELTCRHMSTCDIPPGWSNGWQQGTWCPALPKSRRCGAVACGRSSGRSRSTAVTARAVCHQTGTAQAGGC